MQDENKLQPVNAPATFDDLPVGKSSTHLQTAMLQEYSLNEASLDKLPIKELTPLEKITRKINSSVWKTKKEGFDELIQLVKGAPQEYSYLQEKTILYISQPNPLCQERALQVVLIYLTAGNKLSSEPRNVIRCVIDKCLVSERDEIRHLSAELLFWYMDNKAEDTLFHCLNESVEAKNPKISSSGLLFIGTLLNHYGIKRLKRLEPFEKVLTALAGVVRPTNKQAQIELYKEVFRWVGDNCLKDFPMHHEVKEELNRFATTYQIVPMELKRGVSKQVHQNQKQYQPMLVEEDSLEPMDVLGPYSPRWVDETLEIVKWKDKKAALEEFIKKTRVAVIVPRETSHYITLIKRLLNDNNINLLQCGFKIVQNLCVGLRKHVWHCCKNVFGAVFQKLKDSKANIVEEVQSTLKSMALCLSMEEMSEQIRAGLEDKAASMRLQAIKFLNNFVNNKQNKTVNCLRSLLDKLIKLNEDGSADVRQSALDLLCRIKQHQGIKFFGEKLKNLGEKKIEVIQSASNLEESLSVMDVEEHPVSISLIPDIVNSQVTRKPMVKRVVKSTHEVMFQNELTEARPTVLPDISSHVDSVRLAAYTALGMKPVTPELVVLLKNKACKESSPNILKAMLVVVKKLAQIGAIELDLLEFVLTHDWRKCKNMLTEFLQNSKFTSSAEEFIKSNNLLGRKENSSPVNALKTVAAEFQNLLPKMSSPFETCKIEAAEQGQRLVQSMGKVAETEVTPVNGWSNELTAQVLNVLKSRLSEANLHILNGYGRLTQEMLQKGLLNKMKSSRFLVPTLIGRLHDCPQEVKPLMGEFVQVNPQYVFSFFSSEILNDNLSESILDFLLELNEDFVKFAELKRFILPLLHVMFKGNVTSKCREKASQFLDQIVELCGESVLQKEVRDAKMTGCDTYLLKWNICSKVVQTNGSLGCKADRIRMDEEDPWPISVTPTQIHKLIQHLLSIGQPFASLATPFALGEDQFLIMNSLEDSFFREYSDLLLKWVLWRVQVDRKESVHELLRLSVKIVYALRTNLAESEVIVLLSGLLNALKCNRDCLLMVGEVCSTLCKVGQEFREKSFRFWINSLTDVGIINPPTNEILSVLVMGYASMIPQEMVTLARIPSVTNSADFKKYLRANFDDRLLNVYGFKNIFAENSLQKQGPPTVFLSNLGGPQNSINILTEEVAFFRDTFKKSSQEMEEHLREMVSSVPKSTVMELHLKIIHSITVPFLNKELPFLNPYTYFKFLQKGITESYMENVQTERMRVTVYLSGLLRMLLYLLVDLDDANVENKKEMQKIVNKTILVLFENEDVKHLLEILFALFKTQLKNIISVKLFSLLPKCISKVAGNHAFKMGVPQYMPIIFTEVQESLTSINAEQPDSLLVKNLKNMFMEIGVSNSTALEMIYSACLVCPLPLMAMLLKEAHEMALKKMQNPGLSRDLLVSGNELKKLPDPILQVQRKKDII